MELVSISFQTTSDFNKNLDTLKELILKTKNNCIINAPELCLNGYAYDRLDEACDISQKAIKELKKLSTNKIISLTLTIKQENRYFNTLHIFYKNKIIYTQSKHKLFVLNDEKKHFSAGSLDDIKIIDVDGIKIGALICFELRFIEIWERLKGADLILVPAMWGKPRKEHFLTLNRSLAIMNQCYVIASNSKNSDMANGSQIITPFGKVTKNDNKNILSTTFDPREIKKMRKYMNIGL